MIHQFIFSLEGASHPRTTLPEAGMVRYLRTAHMLNSKVGHNLVHARECLIARFPVFFFQGFFTKGLNYKNLEYAL